MPGLHSTDLGEGDPPWSVVSPHVEARALQAIGEVRPLSAEGRGTVKKSMVWRLLERTPPRGNADEVGPLAEAVGLMTAKPGGIVCLTSAWEEYRASYEAAPRFQTAAARQAP